MKKKYFTGLIILLTISACARQENKVLQGTWVMVQMQWIEGRKVTNYFSDRYSIDQIKMWSGKHFSFVGRYRVDTVTSYRFGTGTFRLEDNRYEEDILYHFNPVYEGITNKMLLDFSNDTLRHVFPVDENGQADERGYYIEKYVRLE